MKKFAVNVPDNKMDPNLPRWFLPMHAVDKYNKICMFQNVRAGINGTCLYNFLFGGPNLITPLINILKRFGKQPITFMTDISALFHNIHVDKRDRQVFRYLWFKDETCREMFIKQFLSHIFGPGSSTVVTAFVLRYHADKICPFFPDNVWRTMRKNIYMDDCAGGRQNAIKQKF